MEMGTRAFSSISRWGATSELETSILGFIAGTIEFEASFG